MGFGILSEEQNRETGRRLVIATGFMFTLPFVAFFIGQYIFQNKKEPDNWAGGMAIIMTNIIVGGYCYMAFNEDGDGEDSVPKVGVFKQRVD
mmetsp:Transcript_20101/g.55962  ORF Transcript_20101/g.55962 Transcript_20101/m.55962 type:complete len:92 (+) Transcript_20101:238-513(+)|eukprot:CAMPEP_0198126020 /NCGR_PEP_ID=MMETSP1442-20131203/43845_1 /TAXON_ID= /ORGANISM="Craspedostauros australis, Strain CCMP3328" /LENGTH=91 /DNA_ID=CAMNT_0043785723 /DNA_START=372 /DNA_END=647 /DNA_ORIENTATION=+